MVVIHFLDTNNSLVVLSQFRKDVPTVNEKIRIKGRNGKIQSINKIKENLIHVNVIFEEISNKKTLASKDTKKKKR